MSLVGIAFECLKGTKWQEQLSPLDKDIEPSLIDFLGSLEYMLISLHMLHQDIHFWELNLYFTPLLFHSLLRFV